MRTRVGFFGFALAFAWAGVGAADFQSPTLLSPTSVVTLSKQGVTVAMNSMAGRPLVEVRINGRGPYWFMLDTGATMTLLDSEVARELSLLPAARSAPGAQAGEQAPKMVTARELQIGEATMTNCHLVVMPMRMPGGADGPSGILSASSFPGYKLTLNYPQKTVTLISGSLPEADGHSVFQYSEADVLPTVPVQLGGQVARVHVDTGSPFGLTLPLKFLSRLPLEAAPTPGRPVRTPAGEFPVSIARVRGTISVGEIALQVPEIFFSDARPSPAPAVGNIGSKVLNHFVVTLDSKNRRVELRAAPAAKEGGATHTPIDAIVDGAAAKGFTAEMAATDLKASFALLERLTHPSYQDFVATRIAGPLGLRSLRIAVSRKVQDLGVRGDWENGDPQLPFTLATYGAAGAVMGSALDLLQ